MYGTILAGIGTCSRASVPAVVRLTLLTVPWVVSHNARTQAHTHTHAQSHTHILTHTHTNNPLPTHTHPLTHPYTHQQPRTKLPKDPCRFSNFSKHAHPEIVPRSSTACTNSQMAWGSRAGAEKARRARRILCCWRPLTQNWTLLVRGLLLHGWFAFCVYE